LNNATKAIPVLLIGLLSLTAQAETNMRCGNYIIGVDNSPSEIISRCGEPTEKRSTTLPSTYRNRYGEIVVDHSKPAQEISEWVYNFGADKLMMQLRFVDGQLQDVKTLGYGH
jgi:hypothetical protein